MKIFVRSDEHGNPHSIAIPNPSLGQAVTVVADFGEIVHELDIEDGVIQEDDFLGLDEKTRTRAIDILRAKILHRSSQPSRG